MIMNAIGMDCNSSYRSGNLNSLHHSRKAIKHINDHRHMIIIYHHIVVALIFSDISDIGYLIIGTTLLATY